MKLIKDLFPEAKFIYIKRDPVFIAQSIYIGRMKNTKDMKSEWWSVNFPGYESLLQLPVETQIAHQVFELEKLIDKELNSVDPNNIWRVNYEDLEVNHIAEQFQTLVSAEKRKDFDAGNVKLNHEDKKKIGDEEYAKLKSELSKLYTT